MHYVFPVSAIRHAERTALRVLKTPARRHILITASVLLAAAPLYAQTTSGSPWENAVQVLQAAFTSTIARGLSLVAIVVGGLMFAFGEGQSKRVLAGIIFGVGMSIGGGELHGVALSVMPSGARAMANEVRVAARWATVKDVQMLRILVNSAKYKPQYDP
jgi:type IV secretion system protein TrbC